MITFKLGGSTHKTQQFLKSVMNNQPYSSLESIAQRGVEALRTATPIDTGATAASWSYEIDKSGDKISIYWINSNVNEGENIAILLQFGHGTGTGGYVSGQDYINPAIRPIFDEIANDVWKKVTSS